MQYSYLGRTGLRVSCFSLGTMMLGRDGNPDGNECIAIIRGALDHGVNLIDTADTYSLGESEEVVGAAIRGRRDEVILATKGSSSMGTGPNQGGASRLWIMKAVEASLRRLGTDYIDLYQIHRPDLNTDLEETLACLTDLVTQGKIRYFGSSTFPSWLLMEAHWVSERSGLRQFSTEQPPYSIFARQIESDVLPVAERLGIGIITWSPLAGGWLTGKYRQGNAVPPDSRAVRSTVWARVSPQIPQRFDMKRAGNKRKLELVERLDGIAREAGVSLTTLALAFARSHPGVASVVVGPRTRQHLEAMLPAIRFQIDGDTLDAIDGVVAPGTVVEESDLGWIPPWLSPEYRRR